MPLATNPNKTLPVWLESDADVPMETRPVFLCRFLTRFEIHAVADELDAIPQLTDMAEAHKRINALLAKGIVGWRNMTEPGEGGPVPIGFGADRFDRVLHPQEKWELADLMLSAPRLKEADRGKSTSSPTSTPDSSAPGVREERAGKTSKTRSLKSAGKSSASAR